MAARPAYERETYLEDIKALRERGFTYPAIAAELGLSRTTIWRIEQGR